MVAPVLALVVAQTPHRTWPRPDRAGYESHIGVPGRQAGSGAPARLVEFSTESIALGSLMGRVQGRMEEEIWSKLLISLVSRAGVEPATL